MTTCQYVANKFHYKFTMFLLTESHEFMLIIDRNTDRHNYTLYLEKHTKIAIRRQSKNI